MIDETIICYLPVRMEDKTTNGVKLLDGPERLLNAPA